MSTLFVLDTGTLIINSVALKYQVVQFMFPLSVLPVPYQDTIIERIGFINSYFLPYDYCTAVIDGNEGAWFRCYSDNSFATYKPHFLYNCDFILGADELENNSGIKIYPNPVNDNLNLEIKYPGSEKMELTVYNVLGEKIFQRNVTAGKTILNSSGFSKGIYFLRLAGRNVSTSKSFVKE